MTQPKGQKMKTEKMSPKQASGAVLDKYPTATKTYDYLETRYYVGERLVAVYNSASRKLVWK